MWGYSCREEYDRLLAEKNAAEENAIFAYQKKKGLIAEKKMVRLVRCFINLPIVCKADTNMYALGVLGERAER